MADQVTVTGRVEGLRRRENAQGVVLEFAVRATDGEWRRVEWIGAATQLKDGDGVTITGTIDPNGVLQVQSGSLTYTPIRKRLSFLRASFCAIVANILALVVVVPMEIAYLPAGLILAVVISGALMVGLSKTRRAANALFASATAIAAWLLVIFLEAL